MDCSIRVVQKYKFILILPFIIFLLCCSQKDEVKSLPVEEKSQAVTKDWYQNQASKELHEENRCIACHQDEYEDWKHSQHAHANRSVGTDLDKEAFAVEKTIEYGDRTVKFYNISGKPVIEEIWKGKESEKYFPVAVIGIEPLIQYLVDIGGGQLQAYDFAYDVDKKEWFNVFKDEQRLPNEWGYWKNRGMNWNSQCAFCHMTDFKKNFDSTTNTYNSTWKFSGVSCTQCHGEMADHPNTLNVKEDIKKPGMDTCAACHSVREELDSEYNPHNSFHDEYGLTLVDIGDRYYSDGQILEEDFEYASFIMSRMHHKGVNCLDCHNPHSGKLRLPVENNALCMSCHTSPGVNGAIPIDPLAHSHHGVGSSGNSCVECHMAETTYMARDDRRDHGFIKPDPFLTKEIGIPNSCNRCHEDKTVDWAIEWTDKWYPNLANSINRSRAILVQKARTASEDVSSELIERYEQEEIIAWKANMVGLLRPWANMPKVIEFCQSLKNHPEALVRHRAAQVLVLSSMGQEYLKDWKDDAAKVVRISAIQGWMRAPGGSAFQSEEFLKYIKNQQDQPSGLMKSAEYFHIKGQNQEAINQVKRASDLDKTSAHPVLVMAEMLSIEGKTREALKELKLGAERFPENAQIFYSIGLIESELKNFDAAIVAFKKCLKLDENMGVGWKNLALVYGNINNFPECLYAIRKAVTLDPNNLDYIYILAWTHYSLKNFKEAQEVLMYILSIDPQNQSAIQLLQSMR